MMPKIDRWVVEQAITHFDHLLPDSAPVAQCAINLSGHTVDDESFADFVIELLRVHKVPADKLCFEITETAAISNMARVVQFIEKLRAVGRSEEHTSELQSLMRISYAVFCLTKKNNTTLQ